LAYSIQHIAKVISADFSIQKKEAVVNSLLTDSRRLLYPSTTLYFALTSTQNDGNLYINELIDRGVENFVVAKNFDYEGGKQVNFLKVDNVLDALQKIASSHRQQFNYPVIGITGSNGKTIVKEWLYELLHHQYKIVRSPRSYNSQIGVPLSVWAMSDQDELGIFEAGISQQGEMDALEFIIRPTIGIITGVGTAHQEGFASEYEKLEEKLSLFKQADIVIGPYLLLKDHSSSTIKKTLTWGEDAAASLYLKNKKLGIRQSTLQLVYEGKPFTLDLPFSDNASIENAITCCLTLLQMNFSFEYLQRHVKELAHLDMRMQIKKGINGCSILNDSYSNDLYALQIGFEYAKQQAGDMPITLIVSDFGHTHNAHLNYSDLLSQMLSWPLHKLITIGPLFEKAFSDLAMHPLKVQAYKNTNAFMSQVDTTSFKEEFVMLKGARQFELEQINALLEFQVHQTMVEVNLTALVNNYKKIKSIVGSKVQIMAMVKAFGYGSGSIEVARALQFHHVNYLAVAYADEGVELRKAGVHLPIMVMNVDESSFGTLVQYHLEPEIFSFELLSAFANYILKQAVLAFPIHIKLNTGMNRLGFDLNEIDNLCTSLKELRFLKVQSIFSHLSASGQAQHREFTQQQLSHFQQAAQQIEAAIGHTAIKHMANSDAILADPAFHLDMVRLGIGMYGVHPGKWDFENVVQLQTTISQIRTVQPGQTVGYNLAGAILEPSRIATVRIGYADGYSRKLGRGRGSMWLNGQLAPVIGDVCMDMTMIDITKIQDVQVGDKVEVFGAHINVAQVAEWAETIPYEILTSIGQRVKRIYLQD
jgi:alanine racemase